MTEHQTKIQKRRFKGFTGAWEEVKLGEIVEFFSGLTYSPQNVINGAGTLVLRSSNVREGRIIDNNNVYVKNEVVNSEYVKKGDIIVVVRNGSRDLIGKHAQIKHNVTNTVIGAFMTGIRTPVPNFVNSLLDTHQFINQVNQNLGATINQITTGAFKEMQFIIPTDIQEQQKIGDFFSELDERIELQKSKVEKMKELKKAYLSEMFPAEGETTPKRRFKEFIKNDISIFKKCYLKDLGNIVTGATPKTSVAEYWENGDILFVSPGDMLGNKYVKNTEKKVTSSGAASVRIIPAKSVMVTCIGSTIGKMALSSKLCVTNQQINTIIPNEEYDSNFIYYALCNNRNLFEELKGTTAVPIINKSDFQDLQIMLPSKEEQKKIGEFFSELDEMIELHEEKLKKLQDLKQAYLNELLI